MGETQSTKKKKKTNLIMILQSWQNQFFSHSLWIEKNEWM